MPQNMIPKIFLSRKVLRTVLELTFEWKWRGSVTSHMIVKMLESCVLFFADLTGMGRQARVPERMINLN